MKKILALSAFVSLLAVAAPGATQSQVEVCDEAKMETCTAECRRMPLNSDQELGCVLGCGIATNCP